MHRFITFICLLTIAAPVFSQNKPLEKEIKSIIQGKKATVGIAVMLDDKIITVNDCRRYPLMSVFKFHQALAVLDHLDKNNLPLDTQIHIAKADLRPDTYSPLRDSCPEGDFNMSLRDLLKYSVSKSDNNACDILFDYLGGTEILQQYIKKTGVKGVSINATENEMHKKFENQYLNRTSPTAAVRLLKMFSEAQLLSSGHKQFLENTMIETVTGPDKLKALLPADVILGHKTGSSDRSKQGLKIADNDIGFVRLPDGRQYYIAVFVMDSQEDDRTNAALIARISKAVYDHYSKK